MPDAEAGGFVDLRNQLLNAASKPVLAKLTSLNQEICKAWDREWPARRPKLKKAAAEITFLDPACGSGHFLLEAFDLLYTVYEEESILRTPEEICASILNHNLFGIDIDERAIQISVAALWMHALERAPHLESETVTGLGDHIIAANLSLPSGRAHLEEFLVKHPEDAELRPALEAVFRGLADANQLGTLLRIEEPVEQARQRRKEEEDRRAAAVLRQSQTKMDFVAEQYVLAVPDALDYEAWKRDVLDRLKEHFRREAAISDPVQAFFGRDATQGLALFEQLARRYDVVAANPPYMGSGNMGSILKAYVSGAYTQGKADLYSCFFERCRELSSCYVSMISLDTWMYLQSFGELRRTVLTGTSIELVGQLGRYAFSEADPPGSVCMVCVMVCDPRRKHRFSHFQIKTAMEAAEQARLIRDWVRNGLPSSDQCAFLEIDGYAISLGTTDRLLEIFRTHRKLGVGPEAPAQVAMGSSTKADPRFLRWFWEVDCLGARWFRFTKGGRYQKWCGLETHCVDWGGGGVRPKRSVIEKYTYLNGNYGWVIKYENLHFSPGLTYTNMARGSLGCRLMDSAIPGHSSHAIYPLISPRAAWLALLNSHVASALLRVLTRSLTFETGYVAKLPVVDPSSLAELGETAVRHKRALVLGEMNEWGFDPDSWLPTTRMRLRPFLGACEHQAMTHMLSLLLVEGEIERRVCSLYALDEESRKYVDSETGILSTELPIASQDLTGSVEFVFLPESKVIEVDAPQSVALKDRLAALLFEGIRAEEFDIEVGDVEEDDQTAPSSNVGRSIPWENPLEIYSHRLGLHPISVQRLLNEVRLANPERVTEVERATLRDLLSTAVLKTLNFRWPTKALKPKQLGALEGHSIVPISELVNARTLFRRVSDLLTDTFEGSPVGEVENVLQVTLARWLEREFCSHHTRQFRSRPIAWQMQSQASGLGATPVFCCLINCHGIPGALPSIRTEYAGALRANFESEQGALERLSQLTVEQVARKGKLGFWIEELRQFEAKLGSTEAQGFATQELRRHAILDAVHSLARRWLGRLQQTIRSGPLGDWQQRAEEMDLHPALSSWIAASVDHADRQCVALAPGSPVPDTPDEELTPAALAESFRLQSSSMIRSALEAICREWQSQFDKALLQPLREQIKAADEEYKQMEDNIDNKLLRKDLKSKVKALKSEIAALAAKSRSLADQICDWRCPKAEQWIEWLATQPLYDEFTSHDGRRSVPKTVAEFVSQESQYAPDINDGVRVNIAPLQKAGILARDVLAAKDVDKAIADRAEWRADERRWCRQGVLTQPGWWPEVRISATDAQDTVSDTAGI